MTPDERSGVYSITHTSGRQYIGSSTNIPTRLATHRRQLQAGTHHCPALQADYATNPDALTYTTMQTSSTPRLTEQRLIIEALREGRSLYNTRSAARQNVTTETEYLDAIEHL